jgi:hypothetical protein
MVNDWVKQHRRIKKAVDEKKDCVNIYDISREVNESALIVKQHFEIMKIDGYGNFMDKEKKIFCTVRTPSKVLEYIAKNKEKI